MKKLIVSLLVLTCACAGTAVFAASGTNIGTVAGNVTASLYNVAKLITAASYVVGLALAVVAIMKFKAHKEAPTQVPLSTAVVLLFISIALIFAPSVFKVGGGTLFGTSGTVAGVSGVTGFGATKASPNTGSGG